jgi:hypothetical protein
LTDEMSLGSKSQKGYSVLFDEWILWELARWVAIYSERREIVMYSMHRLNVRNMFLETLPCTGVSVDTTIGC